VLNNWWLTLLPLRIIYRADTGRYRFLSKYLSTLTKDFPSGEFFVCLVYATKPGNFEYYDVFT
jgi:hypothetical protein